jgi:uncharacterized protein YndB with AHSA1/START domain
MPAAFQNDTDCVIDRTTHTIRFVRDLDADPAQVFDAWTRPERIACWWDATGARLAECEIDLRPGGRFTFVSSINPDHVFSGVYQEIAPPGRLTFEANGAQGRVLLDPVGAGTRMTVEIACMSAEHLGHYLQVGVEVGTSQTLTNLATYLREETVVAG